MCSSMIGDIIKLRWRNREEIYRHSFIFRVPYIYIFTYIIWDILYNILMYYFLWLTAKSIHVWVPSRAHVRSYKTIYGCTYLKKQKNMFHQLFKFHETYPGLISVWVFIIQQTRVQLKMWEKINDIWVTNASAKAIFDNTFKLMQISGFNLWKRKKNTQKPPDKKKC